MAKFNEGDIVRFKANAQEIHDTKEYDPHLWCKNRTSLFDKYKNKDLTIDYKGNPNKIVLRSLEDNEPAFGYWWYEDCFKFANKKKETDEPFFIMTTTNYVKALFLTNLDYAKYVSDLEVDEVDEIGLLISKDSDGATELELNIGTKKNRETKIIIKEKADMLDIACKLHELAAFIEQHIKIEEAPKRIVKIKEKPE